MSDSLYAQKYKIGQKGSGNIKFYNFPFFYVMGILHYVATYWQHINWLLKRAFLYEGTRTNIV